MSFPEKEIGDSGEVLALKAHIKSLEAEIQWLRERLSPKQQAPHIPAIGTREPKQVKPIYTSISQVREALEARSRNAVSMKKDPNA